MAFLSGGIAPPPALSSGRESQFGNGIRTWSSVWSAGAGISETWQTSRLCATSSSASRVPKMPFCAWSG